MSPSYYSYYRDSAHLPELFSECLARNVQLQDKAKSSEEGHVYVVDEVGGENDDAREPLNVVQQNANIDVRIPVRRGPVCVYMCVCGCAQTQSQSLTAAMPLG